VNGPRTFFLLFILFVLPVVVLALYAIAPGWTFPDILPTAFGGRALREVSSMGWPLVRSIASSLGYSLLTVGLSFCLCLLPARHLARHELRGKSLVEGLLLAPALVPPMTFSMGVHYMFLRVGLADTLPGVVFVLTAFSYPYMLRALIAGYHALGEGYDMCAKNLGAGLVTRIVRLDLPLLVPSAVAGGSVVFLVAFSDYFLVFLIGGGSVPSFTGYLFPYLTGTDRSVGSVLTILFLLVPMALFFLLEASVSYVYRRRGMY
jgi:ABC-type spermidine/putrescine transport system permease subunit II